MPMKSIDLDIRGEYVLRVIEKYDRTHICTSVGTYRTKKKINFMYDHGLLSTRSKNSIRCGSITACLWELTTKQGEPEQMR